MDYNNYTHIKTTPIEYSLDEALPYGEIPNEALISKFDETPDYNDGEGSYNAYARGEIKDWSPDPANLESDEPRRNYNSKGFLNVLHRGGRGTENTPAHPEMFLEMTEKDPRGINVDPDMRRMVDQQAARMRFKRFSTDADNSISQGRWSESEAFRKARLETHKAIKPRLRVFSTAKDGRREGMRRDQMPHVSNINRVEEDTNYFRPTSSTYADLITDKGLNPSRKTQILSNKIVRDSAFYHRFTTDHEYKVAKYGQTRLHGRLSKVGQDMNNIRMEKSRTPYTVDDAQTRKTVGQLMHKIISQKNNALDAQLRGETRDTQMRKAGRNSTRAKHSENAEFSMDMQDATDSKSYKSMIPQMLEHLMRIQTNDRAEDAHMKLTAELMYKSVMGKADVREIQRQISNDADYTDTTDTQSRRQIRKEGYGKRQSNFEVNGKQTATATYKTVIGKAKGAKRNLTMAEFMDASNTKFGRTPITNYRITTTNDVSVDKNGFSDNTSKERHIAAMGDKHRSRRHLQTDIDYEEFGN